MASLYLASGTAEVCTEGAGEVDRRSSRLAGLCDNQNDNLILLYSMLLCSVLAHDPRRISACKWSTSSYIDVKAVLPLHLLNHVRRPATRSRIRLKLQRQPRLEVVVLESIWRRLPSVSGPQVRHLTTDSWYRNDEVLLRLGHTGTIWVPSDLAVQRPRTQWLGRGEEGHPGSCGTETTV